MDLVKAQLAHKKSQNQVKKLCHQQKTLKAELALENERAELARHNVLTELEARSLAMESVDYLTTKVSTLEKS